MHQAGVGAIDPGRVIDWGRTSRDYATHRPGPPLSLFDRLASFGVGINGQRILDLGTGTGAIARGFARRGAAVVDVDVAANQVREARRLSEGLDARFAVARAEALPFPPRAYDAASANQCWLYFDHPATLRELSRVLVPGGLLAVSHFSWLASDPIAKATEALVLSVNPAWTGAGFIGDIGPTVPDWARGLSFVGLLAYDEAIPFTREGWRGRIRACRGIGASLPDDQVAAFDREHAMLLERMAPERFTVRHRVDAHVVRLP
jgi:SAM-dependent methyltransferase